jgi:hypothetical protein
MTKWGSAASALVGQHHGVGVELGKCSTARSKDVTAALLSVDSARPRSSRFMTVSILSCWRSRRRVCCAAESEGNRSMAARAAGDWRRHAR